MENTLHKLHAENSIFQKTVQSIQQNEDVPAAQFVGERVQSIEAIVLAVQ